jgi:hypothetical protein
MDFVKIENFSSASSSRGSIVCNKALAKKSLRRDISQKNFFMENGFLKKNWLEV